MRSTAPRPTAIGTVNNYTGERELDIVAFDIDPQDTNTTAVAYHKSVTDGGRPFVVASQYGLGRVTLIGANLTEPRVLAMGLLNNQKHIWHRVLGWRSPALLATDVQDHRDGKRD